jgi:iron complex transport system substrate-binding protein
MGSDEVCGWRQRGDALVMVCGRCRPEDGGAWMRRLRKRLYAALGADAVTVTACGCVRTCPAGKIAVVLAGPGSGCREWAIAPESPGGAGELVALLSHPSAGIFRNRVSHRLPGVLKREGRGRGMRARRGVLGSVVAVALALTACGGPSGTADATAGAQQHYAKTTVSDCNGRQAAFTAPPKRVVALTDSVLEMLFWLGVQDKVVGIGAPPKPGTFPPQFDAAVQKLPKLAGPYAPGSYKPVSREQLLAARPDFVIGGWSSNFDSPGATSQQELTDEKIPSYLALSTSCSAATTSPRTSLDVVYRDLENLGRIFGVSDRATKLIDQMKAKTGAVAAKLASVSRPSVFPFEFDEGTQTPSAPGNRQAINAVITMAGGRSIFADLNAAYQKVSWEQIAQRNPDVILLIVYDQGNQAATDADFAKAEQFVRTFPALAGTPAVKQGRFAKLVYEQGSNGGVRNADAVVSLARQLHPEQMR